MQSSPWELMNSREEMRNTSLNVLFYAIPLFGTLSKWMDWFCPEPLEGTKEQKVVALKRGQMEDLAWMVSKVLKVALFVLPVSFSVAVISLALNSTSCLYFYNQKERAIEKLVNGERLPSAT